MTEEKKQWGGRREGAGRPATSEYTKMISVRVTQEAYNAFKDLDNKSEYFTNVLTSK